MEVVSCEVTENKLHNVEFGSGHLENGVDCASGNLDTDILLPDLPAWGRHSGVRIRDYQSIQQNLRVEGWAWNLEKNCPCRRFCN